LETSRRLMMPIGLVHRNRFCESVHCPIMGCDGACLRQFGAKRHLGGGSSRHYRLVRAMPTQQIWQAYLVTNLNSVQADEVKENPTVLFDLTDKLVWVAGQHGMVAAP